MECMAKSDGCGGGGWGTAGSSRKPELYHTDDVFDGLIKAAALFRPGRWEMPINYDRLHIDEIQKFPIMFTAFSYPSD